MSSSVSATPAKPIEAAQQAVGGQPNDNKAGISSAPQAAPQVLSREEKVEYRDQDGNLLDEEQVKALEGKVEFQTKYETKTRVVDDKGNELEMPVGGWPEEYNIPVAPPHPDAHGVNKETVKKDESVPPQDMAASKEGEKEAENSRAKPASEGKQATLKHEEL